MRQKHGQYDDNSGLPDNTGQPVGSGLVIRLQAQARIHFPHLLAASIQQKNGRQWLLEQLKGMNDPQAQAIFQEYIEQRRRDGLLRAQRDRYRMLRELREQTATIKLQYMPGLQKQIARVEHEIAKAIQRHGEWLAETAIQTADKERREEDASSTND